MVNTISFTMLILLIFIQSECQNKASTQQYSFTEANAKIQAAGKAVDALCETTHTFSLVPGSARIENVDACVNSLKVKLLSVQLNKTSECQTWNVPDPLPIQCKTIFFSVK